MRGGASPCRKGSVGSTFTVVMNHEDLHRRFESFANGDVQVGEMPEWMHTRGKCAWYVYQGPYHGLGNAFGTFMGKVHAKGLHVEASRGTSTSAIRRTIRAIRARS